MKEKILKTELGNIYYWINNINPEQLTLVFLPGLTANHQLFEKQVEFFKDKYNILVWDAPGHGKSWPFDFNFELKDKAIWLNQILNTENINKPVIVGQSMGGYVGQVFSEIFPDKLRGFISIDSAPLQRFYYSNLELFLLRHMEKIYFYYPWKWLLRGGTRGVATSNYGRKLMLEIMQDYNNDKKRYSRLAGHGFKILAEAIKKDLNYQLKCPTLLICGTEDKAGSAKHYNKQWSLKTGYPIKWIKGAGHNSNTDRPEEINFIISNFIKSRISGSI